MKNSHSKEEFLKIFEDTSSERKISEYAKSIMLNTVKDANLGAEVGAYEVYIIYVTTKSLLSHLGAELDVSLNFIISVKEVIYFSIISNGH